MHHSVSDGLSGVLLIRELCHSYSSIMKGGELCLPPLPVQYSDYAVWQRRWLEETGEMATQLAYWKGQLAGAPQLLELPTDKPRAKVQSFAGGSVHDKVVVGMPWNGRNKSEVQHLIGYFINPLALCVDVDSALPFSRMVQHVRDVVLTAMEHADAPFQKVVEAVGSNGVVGHNPIFQSMVVPSDFADGNPLPLGPDCLLHPQFVQQGSSTSKMDVSLVLTGDPGSADQLLLLEYRTDLWCEASMQRLGQQLVCLASSAVASPETPVGRLPMMTEAERRRVVEEWNATDTAFACAGKCLHELFDEQASRTPDHVAVETETEQVSYCELQQRADALACIIQDTGVVGMLEDANVSILLTSPHQRPPWGADTSAHLKQLEVPLTPASAPYLPTQKPVIHRQVFPMDLAYVLFTSGTTGRPKGVMVEHRNACNLVACLIDRWQLDGSSRVLQLANPSFDASVAEVFGTLAAGGTLVVHPLGSDPQDSLRRATCAFVVPSVLSMLNPAHLSGLSTICIGGEMVPLHMATSWAAGRRCLNGYGPTESCVFATMGQMTAEDQSVSIGGPLPNVRVYVLDAYLQPTPIGVPGELYIGGAGVARGYANRDDLTKERFLDNPFAAGRLYRTGDLARWLPDGRLQCLGRLDRQVKLSGVRIELGEVESVLEACPGVAKAVAVLQDVGCNSDGLVSSSKRLVAYIVPASVQVDALIEAARRKLPSYMVPSAVVALERLPVTISGKVDARALPPVDLSTSGGRDYVAPRSMYEARVQAVCQDVLGVASLSVLASFHEYGINSLMAMALVHQMRERLAEFPGAGEGLRVTTVLANPSVAELAAAMTCGRQVTRAHAVEPPLQPFHGDVPTGVLPPVSYGQEQMLVLHELDPASPAYNMGLWWSVVGHVDVDILRRSMQVVVARHEALRTYYAMPAMQAASQGAPGAVQVVVPPDDFVLPFEVVDAGDGDQGLWASLHKEASTPFDPYTGPLVRCLLVKRGDRSSALMVNMHHSQGSSTSKMDVSLVLTGDPGSADQLLLLEYRTDLWCEASMQRLGQQLVCLASSAVASPDTPVGRLPMMTEAERRRVVEDWNATDTAFACAGKCLHELFDEQASRTPDHVAVETETEQVSYHELQQRADALARIIRDAGVVVGGRVGLCMKGCAEMVVGMLAILKAGCAYVPLDPEYPAERVQGMVEDADISLLLTSPCQQPPWGADMFANVMLLEVPATSCCVSSPGLPVTRPAASFRVSPADLAYVIFTSGTTGRPKGVMVEHRSACNLVACVIDRWQLDDSSRVLQLTSPSFDMSVSEIFGTLCCGGALVTCRPHDNLHERLHLASFARFTPSLLATLDPTHFPRLAALVSGGERLPLDLMRRWAAGRRLYNSYGPTECTGSATMEPMDASDDIIAIGRPLPNVRIYVLDRYLQPVPMGVPGELCIGGMGVARGYIKQPELTRERFLDNPLGAGRLYRTGDLARWLPDGRLQCLGRLDRQVKLHGFRIELGEVESILEACPGVAKAVAILQDMAGHTDGHVTASKLLVAYVVPASVQVDALMDAARRKLPSYMVPSAVVALERFPVTVSGKVDARALPPVDLSSSRVRQYVAPRNVYEARVQAVCQDVLGVASLSVLASFHEFGINSLMAMALVHQMRERLAELPGAGEGLRVTTVLANPSVAELAAVMARGRQVTWEHAVELPMQSLRGDMATGMLPPISYGQEQMLALHELDPASPAYNMGLWWSVVGHVDVDILRRSMQVVVGRHEALRTHYAMPAMQAASQGVPVAVQVVVPPDDFVLPFEVMDAGDDDQGLWASLHKEASTPFDPYTGPLVRCLLVQRGDHSSALMVNMHHSTGNLTLLLEYRTDLWCEASMQRLGQQLVCLASSAVASPETPVGRLPMMTEAERAQLVESSQLHRWLQTPPSPLTLCDLWDCQVATRPADTAARCQEAALSFAELEDAAVMVSAVLAASGVGAEARVAIVMERSLLMLAAMLGVLKAGACYVSLDPANPPAYLASLLDVASVKALLWDHAVAGRLQGMVGLEQTACFIVDNLVADARNTKEEEGATWRKGPLSLVISSGEALPLSLAQAFLAAAGDRCQLVNLYGSTETCGDATWAPVTRAMVAAGHVTVGRPLLRAVTLVLDDHGQLAPLGVPGELCVGGGVVARGYLHQPELTTSRFTHIPVADLLGTGAAGLPPSGLPQHPPIGRLTPSSTDTADGKTSRSSLLLYRTGDLARLLPCGDLALMGRLDHQVKVRGVRLELGFVEQAMARLPGVAAAGAVLVPATQQGLVDAPGHDTLMAVVSPRRLLPEALLAALGQQLPQYALPARILCVDELPRLISGKLDRRKLLAMAAAEMAEMRRVGTGGGGREASHAAVRMDPLEAKLAALWGKVLRLPSVSVFDDFFNIGGNSLVAVQMQRELARELARDPALAPLASGSQSLSVFSHRTISSMAAEAARALGRTAGRGASGASDDGRAFTGAAAAASLIFRPRSLFARLLGPASSSSGAEPATSGEEHVQSGVLEVVTSNLRFLWSFSVVMLHFGHCGGQNLRCFQNTPLAGLWAPHDNTSLANFVPRAFQGGVLGLSILSGMGAASGGMRPSLRTPLLAIMLALLMEFGVSRAFDDLVRSSKQERFSTTAHLWGLWALAFNQLLLWLCVGIWRGHNHREGPRHQKGGVVLLLLAAGTVQFLLPMLFALLWPPASAAGVHGMWFGPWGMHQLGWEPLGPRILTSALPFAIGYAYNSQITRMVHTVRSHVWLRVVLAAIFVQLTVRSTFFPDILSGLDLRSSEAARFATVADVMATWELGSWWREWPLRVLGYMGALAEDMGMAFSMLAIMPALDGMVTRFGRASLPIYLFHPHVLRLMEPFSFWLLRQVSSNMPLTVTLEVLLPLSFTVCLCLAFSAMQRRGLGVGKTVLGLSIVLHVLKRALV
eukprot:jgi/Mesvir1/15375/Mv06571-RA.1